MTVLWIRAEGDAGLGVGHIMRGVSVAEAAGERGWRVVAVTSPAESGARIFSRWGIAHRAPYDDAGSWLDAVDEADVVVFDGYDFRDESRIASESGATVVVINDLGSFPPQVDVAVNPNPRVDDPQSTSDVALLGPAFAIVRRQFRDRRRIRVPASNRLIVSYGGSDPSHLLSRTAGTLGDVTTFREVVVVLGPDADSVSIPGVEFLRDPPDMAELLDSADAAVVAAGSTVWECCTLGLPFIAIPVVDNQEGIADIVESSGVGLVVRDSIDVAGDLASALRGLAEPETQRRLASGAMRLVDGTGVNRILDAAMTRHVQGPSSS